MTKKIRKAIILACSSLFALSVSAFVGVNVNASAEGESAGTLIGATVRLTEPTTGIRFQTVLTESEYNATKKYTVTKYGTLVIPTDRLSGELTVENKVAENVVCVPFTEDGVYKFNAVIYDIPAWGYGTELTARSYVAYGDSEDALTYVYTIAEERSVLYVAQQALLDEEEAYTASQIGIVDDFNTNAYVYDYSNSVFATTYMALGQATASITDGVLNVTATAENDGVLIPFGSLDVSAMNSVVVKMTSGTSVTVKANATTLGTYNASSEGVDLTTALKASDVTSLSALQFIAAGEDTISISGVTIKSARDINLLYNMDDYMSLEDMSLILDSEVSASLISSELFNNRQVLQMTYASGSNGVVSLALSEENTDFTGMDGLRFWINGGESHARLEVRLGDGTNYNSAYFTLNKNNGNYMTIPFSAFEGNVNLSAMNTISFYYITGIQNAVVEVADISIGTDACYNVDNRQEFSITAGMIDTVDTYDSDASAKANWTGDTTILSRKGDATDYRLQLYNADNIDHSITASKTNAYILGYDYTKVNGFRMEVTLGNYHIKGDTNKVLLNVVVTIGSEGNYYTMSKSFFQWQSNNATYMVCDFAGMTLEDGSSGELDKKKIDTLKIAIDVVDTSVTAYQIGFDDLEFYTATCGAKGAAFTSDFSDSSTQDWGSATFADGIATRTATGSAFSLTYKTASTSWPNYQNSYAIRFRFKTTNVKNISVRLYNDVYASKGIKTATNIEVINDGEYHDYIVYFADMVEATSTTHTGMKFQQIQFYTNCLDSTGGTIVCEKVELLIG